MRYHVAVFSAALAVCASPALSQDDHKTLAPDQMQWTSGPASLPKGAEAVVLYGDPSKEGLFALRLKLPAGYKIPPHTHPKPEVVTVLSGTVKLGMGESGEEAKAQAMPAGSFFAFPPDTVHYVFAGEETVVQLNSVGPWGIAYVNPKDDPRQSQ
jgi:quercetin dioxygenase-like cupin family protein